MQLTDSMLGIRRFRHNIKPMNIDKIHAMKYTHTHKRNKQRNYLETK